MRRRKNPEPPDHRNRRVTTRFSAEEYRVLAERAAARGLALSAYIALAALATDPDRTETPRGGRRRDAASRQSRELFRLLRGAATNLNQLTKRAHQYANVPAELGEVAAFIGEVAVRVDEQLGAE
ncbi:plasmid mobilization protein [Stackebrandtia nassauensis]|uniref:Uncharacterized protein n=1 Tax=Stackebrandtia nassauensis (strain DSM 44728 / CIP 108903 / NRRL B-16338 / NBRC 102104 / LLR-40K-21) TaxID=446470 RepID=D3Q370_STANL|nr:plasmid mobilization relaxosome protein MobC [Stackebrandtia nassauensis]ADD40040.1 hypothetical protein Snas_0322 [Stackebrandtia nassauensis DSM 44728]